MSKLLNKTVNKLKLWAVVCAVIIAAGLIVGVIFGFNAPATTSNVKTLTIQLNSYAGDTDTVDLLESIGESKLKKEGLEDKYVVESEIAEGNIYELIYVFDEKTEDKKIEAAKSAIETAISEKKEAGELGTAFVYVESHEQVAIATTSKGVVWRGILATVVALVFVFVYTSIRFKPLGGAVITGAALLGILLTTAFTALVRIPVTATFAYAVAFAALISAALAVIVIGAAAKAFKAEENKDKDVGEVLASVVPSKEILGFTATLAVALLIVGMVSTTVVQWFTVAAIVALASGLFSALFVLPAAYLPLKKHADKEAAKKARYDYKKGE